MSSDVVKKDGSIQKRYEKVMLCLSDAHIKKAHLTSSSKAGIDDSLHKAALKLLCALGLRARIGNDAARGGRSGDYIMIDDADCADYAAFVSFFTRYSAVNGCTKSHLSIDEINKYLKMLKK
ncbi:hypothetical protein HQ40_01990 [Porphyromonas gulae]|nr:hypothetical protein HQ40_01990 [Porphyromonas gulae]